MSAAVTPDGRYIVVEGRLWRASDPRLTTDVREGFVKQLMDARRAVRAAQKADDAKALRSARSGVQAAKEALGERGAVWWDDGAPDFNRRLIENTPYAQWWRGGGGAAKPLPSFTGEEGPIRVADGR
ncbi:MAG TPA: hypothetical protein VF688_02625 [Allosphingosinicella sp.]|jgi:hypothetical protein